jgi:hypothetical protein
LVESAGKNMQTRRKFLRNCSLVVTAASLAPAAALAQNPAPHAIASNLIGLDQFVRQVNTAFVAMNGSKAAKLLLLDASAFAPVAASAEDADNEKFTLLFRGSVYEALGQDTYQFLHPRLGRTCIFIVPVNRPGVVKSPYAFYAAIFDRPQNPERFAELVARAPRRMQKT